MNNKKATRIQFKNAVFTRDAFKCVLCPEEAIDAHHVIDRDLWPDGGYYVDNGVSLCSVCHINAESGKISCDILRKAAGITNILLPGGFDKKLKYDKWGKIIQ